MGKLKLLSSISVDKIISGTTCIITPIIQITTGAASGCVLTSDASGIASWETPSGGGGTLSGLTDVSLSALTNGDILRYDSGTTSWYNEEIIEVSTNLTAGQLVCYDGVSITGATNIFLSNSAPSYICLGSTTTSPACGLTIEGINITATNSTGGAITICGGYGVGTNTNIGGSVNICGGCACNTNQGVACGGSINMYAGDSYDNNNVAVNYGGCIFIHGGCAKCVSGTAAVGGCVSICGGSGTTGGNVIIYGGYAASTAGKVIICGGCNIGGLGGTVCIAGGYGSTNYGDVDIYAGNDLVLRACNNSGNGNVLLAYNGDAKLCTVTDGICLGTYCGFATDWVATSDCRLKTNIQPISNALSVVNQLCGVCYKFCDDIENENRIGLLAQEVLPILPEVVSHSIPSDDDLKYGITDDRLGLKYDKLTAILIEAIKEQQVQINELKLEIEKIKTC